MPGTTPVEEKIALLLNKAEHTTPEEAEALTAAAEKLMIKFGIEQAQIDAARGAGEVHDQIVEKQISWIGSHAVEWLRFTSRVVDAFPELRMLQLQTRDYMVTGKEKSIAYIIGFEKDVDQFIALIASLQLQAITAQKAWWKTHDAKTWMTKQEKWAERRQFIYSFGSGVRTRIQRSRREIIVETGPGTGLMLRNRGDQVQKWQDDAYPELKKGRAYRQAGGSYAAANAGHTAGLNAATGGSSISGTRAIGG